MQAITDPTWIRLGEVRPDLLTDARLQVHHAVQIAVSATISYLQARNDDSHTALTWSAPLSALVTESMPARFRPFRVAVQPGSLMLLSVDETGVVDRSFTLRGRSITEAHAWLADVARSVGLDATRLTPRKHYSIPPHAVDAGAPFSASESGLTELERYWRNAAVVLDDLARTTPGASPVRVWPHHFDMATLISLPPDTRGTGRTIGVGLSPGDEWYGEPYWYVGPYPHPPTTSLPPLDYGHWHTKGWVGAALSASEFVSADTIDQHRQVTTFLDSAVRACRALLG